MAKDLEMFGREWDKFSNALEQTGKRREELDHRVGRITNKFQAINTNNNLDEELKQLGDSSEEL